ncbi:MAG TPA: glycosyltransferase family 2 protein [Phycisphaerales bacterium]|nr:glycosyltransferase family 2 protein [Phycisphaerales bacterium]
MSLSVVIVCRNNEATIGRTLGSVAGLATEIVALDSGSTDTTIPQLEREGARVERVEWKGHIATKQQALRAAASDWILSIDSDESVEPDLASSIRDFIARDDPKVAGARINRKVWYAGRPLNYTWQPEWRLRLVRRADVAAGLAAWGGIDPHDKLEVIYRADRQPQEPARAGRPPAIVDLPGTLRHDSFTDMRDHLANNLRHAEVSARSLADMGVRSSYWKLATSPAGAFLKQIVLKGAWRDGWRGWAAAGSTAVNTMMKHVLLIERTKLQKEESHRAGP